MTSTIRNAVFSFSLLSAGLGGGVAFAADPSFAIDVKVPATKHGQRAVVRVHIAPGSGYHMNKDFPTAITLTPPDGVSVEKPKLTSKDATKLDETGADFDIALTAATPGKRVVTGDLKFAVCSATSCDPKREKLAFTVDVK